MTNILCLVRSKSKHGTGLSGSIALRDAAVGSYTREKKKRAVTRPQGRRKKGVDDRCPLYLSLSITLNFLLCFLLTLTITLILILILSSCYGGYPRRTPIPHEITRYAFSWFQQHCFFLFEIFVAVRFDFSVKIFNVAALLTKKRIL